MPGQDVNPLLKIARTLPTPTADSPGAVPGNPRGGSDLSLYTLSLVPTKHLLADEGSYFVATNPTPGTLIATGAAVPQSFAATTPTFVLQNKGQGQKRIYLDFLKLLIGGTVPASSTSVQAAVVVDSGPRVPSANFQLIAPVNPNQDSANTSITNLWTNNAGNLTVPAAVNSRLIDRTQLKGGAMVTLDQYELIFGVVDSPGFAMAPSAVGRFTAFAAPVVIGPGQWALIYVWIPAGITNAMSYEFVLGVWER